MELFNKIVAKVKAYVAVVKAYFTPKVEVPPAPAPQQSKPTETTIRQRKTLAKKTKKTNK